MVSKYSLNYNIQIKQIDKYIVEQIRQVLKDYLLVYLRLLLLSLCANFIHLPM